MKVFLSSTYIDLSEHRKLANEALQRLGQHVGRMEVFGARPEEPTEACFGEIESCDIFIGIYAHRYGHIPHDSQYSITELEFDHAAKLSKKMFCFFVEDNSKWNPQMVDMPPTKNKLTRFKQKIRNVVTVDFFNDKPEDLAYKVAASVGLYLSQSSSLKKQLDHISIGQELLKYQLLKLKSKYIQNLYVRRKLEQDIISLLTTRSMKNPPSDKNIFALVDRAGAGKTNILCNIAQILSQQHVVIFLSGNVLFNEKKTLLENINTHLTFIFQKNGIPCSPSDFWDTLRIRTKTEQINCYLIIDGINENPNVEVMANELEMLSAAFLEDRWFTILVSCRDVYWEYFEKNATLMNLIDTIFKNQLYQFDEKEFKIALKKYVNQFAISVDLQGEAYEKCRHPLLLRFFCEAYKGQDLGVLSNIRLLELFQLYAERKIDSIARKMTMMYKHAKLNVSNFLYQVAIVMFNANNRYIHFSLFDSLDKNLSFNPTTLGSNHIESIYARILDEDIIFEEIHSEKVNTDFKKDLIFVTFVYEEFMEYIIACSLEKKMTNLTDTELLSEVEKLFDKQKRFINIFGIMLFLASLIKSNRGLSIWSKLYERGEKWKKVLLDSINKCPEDLIDHELIDLIKQISQSLCSYDEFEEFEEYDDDDDDDDEHGRHDVESANDVLRILRHRKFYKFKNEIAPILEFFLEFPNRQVRKKAVESLGEISTDESLKILLKHFKEIAELGEEFRMSILRSLFKSKNKRMISDVLPKILDKDVLLFIKKHSSFVRNKLNLSKKEFEKMFNSLII